MTYRVRVRLSCLDGRVKDVDVNIAGCASEQEARTKAKACYPHATLVVSAVKAPKEKES